MRSPLTLDVLRIHEPCHAAWDDMTGDTKKRFCDACGKHVHNAEAMTRAEVVSLLRESDAAGVCMQLRPDGNGVVTLRDPSRVRRVGRWLAAAAAVALTILPGCGTRQRAGDSRGTDTADQRTLRGSIAPSPALLGEVRYDPAEADAAR